MRSGTVIRTRIVAFFAMLLMLFGMTGGLPGLGTTDGEATPFVVSAQAAAGPGALFGSGGTMSGVINSLNNQSTSMNTIVSEAQQIAQTITTILTIISFVCLLYYIARLAMSAGNPMTRRQALTGILFAGIALALFGGSWIVVSFFWNVLN